jgi:hypothetical protein
MLVTLVIVTVSAKAQGTYDKPYPGSTYTYKLTGVKVGANGGSFKVTSTLTGTNVFKAMTNVTGNYTLGNSVAIDGGTAFDLLFDIQYGNDAGDGIITVEVKDGTNGCTNTIFLNVDVQSLPTFAVSIAHNKSTEYCQELNPTPTSNKAASDDQINTITFTVTPTVTNLSSNYSYKYKIDLTGIGLTDYDIKCNNTNYNSTTNEVTGNITGGTNPPVDTYTVTFKTTTGKETIAIPGTISNASVTLVQGAGGGTYNASSTTPASINVKTMPSIGKFE